jgi:hypothetical protein
MGTEYGRCKKIIWVLRDTWLAMPIKLWQGWVVTYCFYPEERNCGKDVGFNLMGCAPDVLLVLRICG